MAAAETRLREGEFQAAESHYRDALLEGWLLMGTLARVEGRPLEAREAFRRASTSAFENRLALQALALAHLQLGETAPAVEILRRLARSSPGDVQTRRFLAQALTAGGQPEESLRVLEDTRALAPGDAELVVRPGRRLPGREAGRRGRAPLRADRPRPPDPADPRPHRPHLPGLRRVRARAGRAAGGAAAGPARAPRALLPRQRDGGGEGEGRAGGGHTGVPGGAEARATGPAGEPRAGHGARRHAATRGSPAGPRDRGPLGAAAGAHPLLPGPRAAGRGPAGRGHGLPAAGAGAGGAGRGHGGAAARDPQPAGPGAPAAGRRAGGRARTSPRPSASPPRGRRPRARSWPGRWRAPPSRKPARPPACR